MRSPKGIASNIATSGQRSKLRAQSIELSAQCAVRCAQYASTNVSDLVQFQIHTHSVWPTGQSMLIDFSPLQHQCDCRTATATYIHTLGELNIKWNNGEIISQIHSLRNLPYGESVGILH